MKRAILCAAFFVLLVRPGHSQSGGSGYEPSLGEAIPLEVRDGRVMLAETLLAGTGLVLPAGTLLRNAFPPPTAKEIQRADRTRKDELLETYGSREVGISAINPEDDKRTQEEKALDVKAAGPAWPEPIRFSAFFHAGPTTAYYVAIQSSPEAKPQVVQFRFPDSLVLTERDGILRVRAVGNGSAMAKAGMKAGMELVAVGGEALTGGLATYPRALSRAREAAQLEGRTVPLTVRLPGGETRDLALGVPRSLKNPNDLFSDLLAPARTEAGTPPPAPQTPAPAQPSPPPAVP